MRSGSPDERITIESEQTTINDYSEQITRWVELPTVWAEVRHQRGAESFTAAQTNAARTVKFKTSFTDCIDATMSIIWRGDQYNVYGVDESMRRADSLWITATYNSGAA